MTSVTVIGARGLVGSAFVRLLADVEVELRAVTRDNYAALAGRSSDVVIDAAGNSVKYLADQDPLGEFDRSVAHRVRTLTDFPAGLHVHVSSVDVYSDLSSRSATAEDAVIDLPGCSRYGFHKLLAEQYVRHAASRWLIVRLSGMVGPGLRKNPVFDILNARPLRIHPDSQYQFLHTRDVAAIVWSLAATGRSGEVFNVAGSGLISPRRIAQIVGRPLDLGALPPSISPRVVDINTDKLGRIVELPSTERTIAEFVAETRLP
jgi:nucleoside-diphosphate-sugar epimerase